MHRYFKEEIKESENNDEQGNVLCEIQQQSVRVQVQPNRNRFRFRTIPEEMSFSMQQTFKTPTKARKKQVEKGNVAPAIEHRTKFCPGCPIEVVDQGKNTKDPQQSCYCCGAKTKWQCLHCRFYFCMSYQATKRREEQLYYVKERQSASDEQCTITKIYGNTCFHLEHKEAIEAMTNKSKAGGDSDKENN